MTVEIGYGTKFYRSTDGASFTQVTKLRGLEVPEMARDTVDVSLMDNSDNNNKVRTFQGTLIDGGEVGLTFQWDEDDAQQAALFADLSSIADRWYRIEWENGKTATFNGVVTAWGQNLEIDGIVERTCTVKVSGNITIG